MATATRDNAPAARRRTRRPARRLVLLLGLVVVVAVAGAGGWHFWHQRKAAVVIAKPLQPVYVAIKPFVVTVLDSNQTIRFVQVGVDLEVADDHAADEVKQALPAIQDAIRLKILQSKLSDVTSSQGVEALRKMLIAQANTAVDAMMDPPAASKPMPKAKPGPPPPPPQPLVRNVYFTELVVE